MTEFFKFAAENPWLTFFLLFLVAGTITESFKWLAYSIKGPPPAPPVKEKDMETEDDE